MNWYKRLKFAQIQGEFWIEDGGNIMEMEYGDYNHESYVIGSVQRQVVEEAYSDGLVENDYGNMEFVDWDSFYQEVQEKIGENEDVDQALANIGIGDEESAIAQGYGDVRIYAMKKWGWKRLAGSNVETWELSKGDMDTIASGLYEAYGEEHIRNQIFSVEVRSTGRTQDMTYEELASASRPQTGGLMETEQQAYQKALEQQDQGHPYYEGRQGD